MTPTKWTLAFYDGDGEHASRGHTGESLTNTIRLALLRFERHPHLRYASVAVAGRPFALIAVTGDFTATVTAIAADARAMTEKERRAVSHVENMLRSRVRVHLRGDIPLWRLDRTRPKVET